MRCGCCQAQWGPTGICPRGCFSVRCREGQTSLGKCGRGNRIFGRGVRRSGREGRLEKLGVGWGRVGDGQGPVAWISLSWFMELSKIGWSKTHVVTVSLFLALLGPCRFQDRKGTKQQPAQCSCQSVTYNTRPYNTHLHMRGLTHGGSSGRPIIKEISVQRPKLDHVRSHNSGMTYRVHISRVNVEDPR